MVTIRLTLMKVELQFVAARCKCKLADGNPCCQLFSASMYRGLRDECHALTRDELELVVMEQLRAFVQYDRIKQKTKARNTECVCTSTQFLLGGHRVCTNTLFFFANNEPQEAQVHKSQVDGEWSGPSKPCAAPPSQYHSTL